MACKGIGSDDPILGESDLVRIGSGGGVKRRGSRIGSAFGHFRFELLFIIFGGTVFFAVLVLYQITWDRFPILVFIYITPILI